MQKKTYIRSIADYLRWLSRTSYGGSKGTNFYQEYVFYRGQSVGNRPLILSLFRHKYDEQELLRQASSRLFMETLKLDSNLDKLVFFRHYGLCSRLLDVTFNPLIALFMACEDNDKHSGAVFCGYGYEKNNPELAHLIAEYAFTNKVNGKNLDDILMKRKLQLEKFDEKEDWFLKALCEPVFLFPSTNNVRIEAQNGAFVIAPILTDKGNGNYDYFKGELNGSDFFDEKIAIIPKQHKRAIRHALSLWGFNAGTVYGGISAKLKTIMSDEEYRQDENDSKNEELEKSINRVR